jgi:predicted RNase H-like HicB family nuclease
MRHYIALIHKEPKSDFGVSFPDLPGCITAGSTLDEAMAMASEALALHLEGLAEEGQPIPEPSTIEDVMRDPENGDGIAVLVSAPERRSKTVRVNITLPEDVLREVDQLAEREGYTRSGFLAKKAREAVGDFAVNTAAQFVLHYPTVTAWRYDKRWKLTLAHRGAVDDKRLRRLTTMAEKVLREERNRHPMVKGGAGWR